MVLFTKCINSKLLNNQYISVIIVNLLVIGYGCMTGWMSPYLPVYLSDETPLKSGKITLNELSWISACMSIGCLIGNFSFGHLSNNCGRKRSILILIIPSIASYLFIIFATNVYCLYASQIFNGICGGGLYVAIPLFVVEIAQPKIRGILLSIIIVFNNIGVIIMFIFGVYFSSITSCIILLIIPISFMISMTFIPETPQYLFKRNKHKEAMHSLAYYRNCLNFLSDELFITEFELLKLNVTDPIRGNQDIISFKNLCNPIVLKGIFIGIVLSFMNPFCGCLPLITFTSLFFGRSGSDIDPNKSAILVVVSRFISIYIASILVDKIGRKRLLIVSTILMIIGLSAMGIFSFLYSNGFTLKSYQFVPIVGISFAIFSAGIGIIGIPMVVIPEVIPKNMLSIGMGICTASFSIASFITLKVVPKLIFEIEVYGCMLIFILFCAIGLIFIIFVIPETKGKNLETN